MWTVGLDRIAFGFHNPNHAAALACALFAVVLLTQSRTGLLVAGLEGAAWWRLRKGRFRVSHLRSHKLAAAGIAAFAVAALWWMWPRMALDGSMLNRPRIWLAGLRLFAANPDGVGLGNSGALWGEDDTRRVLPRRAHRPGVREPVLHARDGRALERRIAGGGVGGGRRSWRWEVEVVHGG